MKPNDFKNATLDAVSSFPDVIFPVKGVSLVCFGCSFNRNTLIPLYMQPNCDFFLRENQAIDVLIYYANR